MSNANVSADSTIGATLVATSTSFHLRAMSNTKSSSLGGLGTTLFATLFPPRATSNANSSSYCDIRASLAAALFSGCSRRHRASCELDVLHVHVHAATRPRRIVGMISHPFPPRSRSRPRRCRVPRGGDVAAWRRVHLHRRTSRAPWSFMLCVRVFCVPILLQMAGKTGPAPSR
jgi:hypothetical protein